MKNAMILFGFLGAWGALSGVEAAEGYEVDPAHSSVQWKVQHAGAGYVWGRFTDFSGVLSLDPAALDKSSVSLTVKTGSLLTDNEKRDQHLKSPDFFNTRQFPLITFQSGQVKPSGSDGALLSGELTLKGVKKTVTAQVKKIGQQGDLVGFEATFTLKRSEFDMPFGVGQGLGDEVHVLVNLEAKRK